MGDLYQTVYGLEPFAALGSTPADEYGGGSIITQENLLIGLWRVENNGDLTRVKPQGALDSFIVSATGPGIDNNVFRSKLSARFSLLVELGTEPAAYQAVLQPPRELKQLYLDPDNLAFFDAASPLAGINFNSEQNLFAIPAAWDVKIYSGVLGGIGTQLPESNIDQTLVGSIVTSPIPLLQTNGANGQAPEFYPVGNPGEILNSVNAIKKGAPFYVPVRFALEDYSLAPNFVVDIEWHMSTGRN